MPSSEEVQELILEQLSHGPQGPYVIAAAIHEPPYRVRGELKALKRRRLVHEHLSKDVHLFSITASGMAGLAGHEQLRMVLR